MKILLFFPLKNDAHALRAMNLWSGSVFKTPKVGRQEVYERSCVCTGLFLTKSSFECTKKCVIFSTKKPYFPSIKTCLVTKVSPRSVSLGGSSLHPPLRFWACASSLFQSFQGASRSGNNPPTPFED